MFLPVFQGRLTSPQLLQPLSGWVKLANRLGLQSVTKRDWHSEKVKLFRSDDSAVGSSNTEGIGQGVSGDCRDPTTLVRKDDPNGLRLIEIKSGMTVQKDWGRN